LNKNVVDMADLNGFKIKFAERSHNTPLNNDHLHSSIVTNSLEYCQLPSLVLTEKGKKRFESSYSFSQEFKPGRRSLTPPSRPEEAKHGKRYIPPMQHENDESAFFRSASFVKPIKRSDSTDLPAVGWTRKKMLTEDGNALSSKESSEYNIESLMTRKHSVESLNKLGGDTRITKVEHQPKFYAEGGLIVGSTIKGKKSGLSQHPVSESTATLRKSAPKSSHDADKAEVLSLTAPVTGKQGQSIPSWEERTGCWLVSPEDENF